MRLSLLALIAAGIYEYDKKQVRAGKPSMFADLGRFVGDLKSKVSGYASSNVDAYSYKAPKKQSGTDQY